MTRKKDKHMRNRPTPNKNQDKRRETRHRGGPDPGQDAAAAQGTMADVRRNLRRATGTREELSPTRLMLYAGGAMLVVMIIYGFLRS